MWPTTSYIDCFYSSFQNSILEWKALFSSLHYDENSLFDSYQTKSSISVGTKKNVEHRKIFFLKKNMCMENKIASNFTTSLPLNTGGIFGSVQFPLQIFDFKNHIFNFFKWICMRWYIKKTLPWYINHDEFQLMFNLCLFIFKRCKLPPGNSGKVLSYILQISS